METEGGKNGLLLFWMNSWVDSMPREGDDIVLTKDTAQTWRW